MATAEVFDTIDVDKVAVMISLAVDEVLVLYSLVEVIIVSEYSEEVEKVDSVVLDGGVCVVDWSENVADVVL